MPFRAPLPTPLARLVPTTIAITGRLHDFLNLRDAALDKRPARPPDSNNPVRGACEGLVSGVRVHGMAVARVKGGGANVDTCFEPRASRSERIALQWRAWSNC